MVCQISISIKVQVLCLIPLCLPVLRRPLSLTALFLLFFGAQEYNIHGWWVGELNGTVGIVPKDFLQPAYIL